MPRIKKGKELNPIDVRVGQRIRVRRQELGLSQTALADSLGLTFQQVQKYEKGSNRVGASRLTQIAGFLNVSPGYFFERDNIAVDTALQDMDAFVSSREGDDLMRAMVKVKNKNMRRRISNFVADIADIYYGDDD